MNSYYAANVRISKIVKAEATSIATLFIPSEIPFAHRCISDLRIIGA